MSENFDLYYQWLGIPPREQPPHQYRLLGMALFEENIEVICSTAARQMTYLRTVQSGAHSAAAAHLLNELNSLDVRTHMFNRLGDSLRTPPDARLVAAGAMDLMRRRSSKSVSTTGRNLRLVVDCPGDIKRAYASWIQPQIWR